MIILIDFNIIQLIMNSKKTLRIHLFVDLFKQAQIQVQPIILSFFFFQKFWFDIKAVYVKLTGYQVMFTKCSIKYLSVWWIKKWNSIALFFLKKKSNCKCTVVWPIYSKVWATNYIKKQKKEKNNDKQNTLNHCSIFTFKKSVQIHLPFE